MNSFALWKNYLDPDSAVKHGDYEHKLGKKGVQLLKTLRSIITLQNVSRIIYLTTHLFSVLIFLFSCFATAKRHTLERFLFPRTE